MSRLFTVLSLLFIINVSYAAGSHTGDHGYWQQYVHYTINATLLDSIHTIIGSETLYYKNNSPDNLHKIYIRLYWNLFNRSSYGYKQAMRQRRFGLLTTGDMTMNECSLLINGTKVPLKFNVDNTLAEVYLPSPLVSNSAVTFYITWIGKVPKGSDRAGYVGEDYDIAQWYPQVAVYDRYGWDTDQYMDRGEFYDDYGTFDVNITLPRKFIIGHTGELMNPEDVLPDSVIERLKESESHEETFHIADFSNRKLTPADNRMVTWRFHADTVRDFAWSADPYFIWDVAHWNGIAIHSLYFREKAKYWSETAKMGRHAIKFFSEHLGMYAYKEAFIVQGPEYGGMEYPGVVFIGHLGAANDHKLARTTMHELGHQWYPMMIGSNETRFGFQDEGFNTFNTTLALESYYGRYNNSYVWTKWYQKLLCFPNTDERAERLADYLYLAHTGYEEPVMNHPDHFAEPLLQNISIYAKTTDAMFMLRYVLGDSTFWKVMKAYYDKYKFKHVYPEDFFSLAEKVSGRKDLRWFFTEWLDRTCTCDYGIKSVSSKEIQTDSGKVFDDDITISRHGQIVMPLDIRLRLNDGSDYILNTRVIDWQSGEARRTYHVYTKSGVSSAEINPGQQIADINRLNNTWPLPKVDVRFDNTMVNFYPNDAYLLRWRPSLWYNNIDGVKYGLRLSGTYLGYLHDFHAGLWYGTHLKNAELDYSFEYDNQASSVSHEFYPGTSTPFVSRYPRLSLRAERHDGIDFYSLGLSKVLAEHYSYPPYHTLSFSVNSTMAERTGFLLDPATWVLEKRLDFARAQYSYRNFWQDFEIDFKASYEASLPIFNSDVFNYSKGSIELTSYYTFSGNKLAVRLYDGRSSGNVPPMTKFYLAQGSPLEVFQYPLLRSVGALPLQALQYSRVAGGGSVRAYNGFIAGDKIDAGNFEVRFASLIPFISSEQIPFLGSALSYFRTNLFYDAAFLGNQGENIENSFHFYDDAGIGIVFDIQEFYKLFFNESTTLFNTVNMSQLRFDMPLYVNKPAAAGSADKFEFRWRLSYTTAF